tara:strand:+ start:1982 stop:3766 length:1785 start_codon:yes stop_codon:yes gene_type:complete
MGFWDDLLGEVVGFDPLDVITGGRYGRGDLREDVASGGDALDAAAEWLRSREGSANPYTPLGKIEALLQAGGANVLSGLGHPPLGAEAAQWLTSPTDAYYNSPEYRNEMARDMQYDPAAGGFVPWNPRQSEWDALTGGPGFIGEQVTDGVRTPWENPWTPEGPGALTEPAGPAQPSAAEAQALWDSLIGGGQAPVLPPGMEQRPGDWSPVSLDKETATARGAQPDLFGDEAMLAQAIKAETDAIDAMVAEGTIGIDEAEAAYDQALDKYITGFTNQRGQFVPGFVPKQQGTLDDYVAGMETRGATRGERLEKMREGLIADGVNPALIESDIEFINALYSGTEETEENYLSAMRDIGLMAESELRGRGLQTFGAARGQQTQAANAMERAIQTMGRQASVLGPEFGFSPATYFAGSMADVDMAGVGETRRATTAASTEKALDRASADARAAENRGEQPNWDIIGEVFAQGPDYPWPDGGEILKQMSLAGLTDEYLKMGTGADADFDIGDLLTSLKIENLEAAGVPAPQNVAGFLELASTYKSPEYPDGIPASTAMDLWIMAGDMADESAGMGGKVKQSDRALELLLQTAMAVPAGG